MSLLPGLPVCCAEAGGSPEKNGQWSLVHKVTLFASQPPLVPPRCYSTFVFFATKVHKPIFLSVQRTQPAAFYHLQEPRANYVLIFSQGRLPFPL